MSRYALFCGDNYYPCGGWDDMYSRYDSVDAAQASLKQDFKTQPDWYQIVDLHTGLLVVEDGIVRD